MYNDKIPFQYDDYGNYLFQHYPVEWSQLLQLLQKHEGEMCKVCIPVTENSFCDLNEFNKYIPALVEKGFVCGYATLKGDVIELLYCILNRGVGDDDGYGVEGDEFIEGKMDLKGNYIEKFHLK